MDTSGRSSGTRVTRPLRRNRDFLLLESGLLLSSVGTSLTTVAYPLLTVSVTGSAAKAGLVGFVRLLPFGACSLFAGLAADRLSRKRLMIAADAVRLVAMGAFRRRAGRRRRGVLGDPRGRPGRGHGHRLLRRGRRPRAPGGGAHAAAPRRGGNARIAPIGSSGSAGRRWAFVIWPHAWVLAGWAVLFGVAAPVTDSVVVGYRVAMTPDRLVGRVESVRTTISLVASPLGPLLAGWLFGVTSARTTVAVFALGGLGLLLWGTLSPPLRQAPSLADLGT